MFKVCLQFIVIILRLIHWLEDLIEHINQVITEIILTEGKMIPHLPQLQQMSMMNQKVVTPILAMIYLDIILEEAMIVNIMECLSPQPGLILQPPDLNLTIQTLELITNMIIIIDILKEVLSFHPLLRGVGHLHKRTIKQVKIHPDILIHYLVQKNILFLV